MLIRFKTEHGNEVFVRMEHVEAMVDRGETTVLHMISGKVWNVQAPAKWVLKLSEESYANSEPDAEDDGEEYAE